MRLFNCCSNSLEKDLFLLRHDYIPVCKASAITTWLDEIDVEELEGPTQSPDLNYTEHL